MASLEEKVVAKNASVISSWLEKAKDSLGKVANIPTPEVTVDGISLKGVTFEGVDYHAKVSVKNPYPLSIPICQISYILKSASRTIASGTIPDPGSIDGNETTVLDVQIIVAYNIAISLVQDISMDWDIDYELDIGLTFDIPVIGNITIPISTQGEIKLPSLGDLF